MAGRQVPTSSFFVHSYRVVVSRRTGKVSTRRSGSRVCCGSCHGHGRTFPKSSFTRKLNKRNERRITTRPFRVNSSSETSWTRSERIGGLRLLRSSPLKSRLSDPFFPTYPSHITGTLNSSLSLSLVKDVDSPSSVVQDNTRKRSYKVGPGRRVYREGTTTHPVILYPPWKLHR